MAESMPVSYFPLANRYLVRECTTGYCIQAFDLFIHLRNEATGDNAKFEHIPFPQLCAEKLRFQELWVEELWVHELCAVYCCQISMFCTSTFQRQVNF